MNEEQRKKVALNVDRVWQRHRACKDSALTQAAEHLYVSVLGQNDEQALPKAVEYTCRSADFAYHVAQHDCQVAVLCNDQQCYDWLSEKPTEDVESWRRTTLFSDLVPLDNAGFVVSPLGGWEIVLLRDVLPRLPNDDALTTLLRIVRPTLAPTGLIIVQTAQFSSQTRTEELDGVVLTERYEKLRPRLHERTLTIRTDGDGYRFSEQILTWDVSDLHYCAKQAALRPVSDHGLNSMNFCCYALNNE